MNGIRLSCETSGTDCSRIRPKPLGCLISTAIATIDFVAVSRPWTVPSTPPTYASSTSTRRSAARGLGVPSPSETGAASPTPSGRNRAPHPLKPKRRDALLLAGHQPRRREPRRQRGARAVEDRPRGHRRLTLTHRALPTAGTQPPARATATPRAEEPIRPAQPLEVVDARVIIREPRQQLAIGTRIVLARCRHEPETYLTRMDSPLGT